MADLATHLHRLGLSAAGAARIRQQLDDPARREGAIDYLLRLVDRQRRAVELDLEQERESALRMREEVRVRAREAEARAERLAEEVTALAGRATEAREEMRQAVLAFLDRLNAGVNDPIVASIADAVRDLEVPARPLQLPADPATYIDPPREETP